MRKTSPDAQPTSTLMMRDLKNRRDSWGAGSETAIMEAMAHMGLLCIIYSKMLQTIVEAIATLAAKRKLMRSS